MTRHPRARVIAVSLLVACVCAVMSSAWADPPATANADSATPPIATVTLQPLAPSNDGSAPPINPGPGIRFEDLPNDIGLRVRVLTRNQRVHVGTIKHADARHVTLSIRQYGGSASYALNRDQIERIDPA